MTYPRLCVGGRRLHSCRGHAAENWAVAFAGIIALFGSARTAEAGTYYWDTVSAAGVVWSNSANWWTTPTGALTGGPPGTGDMAVFNGAGVNGSTIVQLDSATSVSGIIFANSGTTLVDASAAGAQTLTIDANGITINSGAGAVTLGNASNILNLQLSANQTWTNNSANTLIVTNGVTNVGNTTPYTLTLSNTAAGGITFNGIISDGGGAGVTALTINSFGSGAVTLAGADTYSGTTTIQAGTLTVASTGSIANSQGLNFSGNGTFNYNAASAGSSTTLKSLTFTGGAATVNLTGGTSGVSSLAVATLNARLIGASANFTTSGTGASISVGTTATGFIDQGTFFNGSNYAWVGTGGALRAISYTSDTGAATSGATSTLTAAATASNPVYQQITGAISAQTAAAFTTLSDSGAFAFTIVPGNTVTANGILTNGTAVFSGGAITTTTGSELVIRTNTGTMTLSTPISNNGATAVNLTKSGTGSLYLQANSTFTGGVYVDQGVLRVDDPNPSNSGNDTIAYLSTASGITVQNGATLSFYRENYSGGGNTNTYSVPTVTLNGGAAVSFGDALGTITNALANNWVVNGNVSILSNGGGYGESINAGGTFTNPNGPATITYNVTSGGTGSNNQRVLTLSSANSTFSGNWVLTGTVSNNPAILTAGAANALGTGVVTVGSTTASSSYAVLNSSVSSGLNSLTGINVIGASSVFTAPIGMVSTVTTTPITLSAGTINIGASGSPGVVQTGSLTMSGGALNLFPGATATTVDQLILNNGLSYTGGTIAITYPAVPAAGTYNIVTYNSLSGSPSGTLTVGGNTFSFAQLLATQQIRNTTFAITGGAATPGSIAVTVSGSGSAGALVWTGAVSNAFDLNNTANFTLGGSPTTFFNNDSVTFNDTPTSGNTSPNIAAGTILVPGSLTFSNNTLSYLLTGGGTIGNSASPATSVVVSGAGSVTISDPFAVGITKTGAGTLTLGTVQSYAGLTTINAGIIKLANSNTIPAADTLAFTNTTSAAGLDITGVSQTFTNITTGTQTTGANTITITGNSSSALSVTGTALTFAPAASNDLLTLNMSTVGTFNYANSAGTFAINGGTAASGAGTDAVVTFGANTNITASSFLVGNVGPSGGISVSNVTLGANAVIDATTIGVGSSGSRGAGNLTAGSGTLTIRDASGGATATLTIGKNDSTTTTDNTSSTLSTTSATLNAVLATINIGISSANSSTTTRGITISGTFNMGAGALTATTLNLGQIGNGGATSSNLAYTWKDTATLGITGGTATIGTIAVAAAIYNISTAGLGAGSTLSGIINLNTGATLNATSISTSTPSLTGTATNLTASGTINWNDGTIGNIPGTNLAISTATNNSLSIVMAGAAANHTFNISTNQTGTISAPIGGAGTLTKTGAGILILAGTTTYTAGSGGAAVVNAGVLRVNGSLPAGAVSVNGGALGGTGTVPGAVAVASGAGLNLVDGAIGTLSLGSTLTFNGAATINLELSNSTTDAVTVTGAVTATNPITINVTPISGTSLAVNTYTLLTFPTSGSSVTFSLGGVNSSGLTYTLGSTTSGTNTLEQLSVTSGTVNPAAAFWGSNTAAGGSSVWTNAKNWYTSVSGATQTVGIPGPGTNVTFYTTTPTAANLSNTLGANFEINSLTIANTASLAITIGGSNTLTIDATSANGNTAGNGITNNYASGTHNISTNIALGASQTWTVVSGGGLNVSGNVTDNGNGYALTVAGGGTLYLRGTNAYSGGTNIASGIVRVAGPSPLGTGTITFTGTSGEIATINGGGAVNLANNIVINPGGSMINDAGYANLTLSGIISGSGSVTQQSTGTLSFTGANSYTGNTTLAATGTLDIGSAGSLGSGAYAGNISDAGTLAYSSSVNQSLSGVLSGAGALTKDTSTTSTLTLSGLNTYSGATTINAGTVTYSGTGASSGAGTLAVNTGVFNINTSGTLTFKSTTVGGTGTAGAINQSSGTATFENNTSYVELGGNGGYGSILISGGTLTSSNSGMRVGDLGGLGVYNQTNGTVTMGGYFVVGGSSGTTANNDGIATFTGGTFNSAGGNLGIIVGNATGASGTLNVGTQAGGSGLLAANAAIQLSTAAATAILNLNAGILQISAGGISNLGGSTATAILNLNGGTLRASAPAITLIDNSLTAVTIYNGGVKIDTLANTAMIAANLSTATGNGVYAASESTPGTIPVVSGGSGYLGAPLVTVSGGSGAGLTAIANVSAGVVTGVTITNPGQGYLSTDILNFTFTGGGATSPAPTFTPTLIGGDVAANGAGGLTKVGTGTLILSGENTYTGATQVSAGILLVNGNQTLATGNVVVGNTGTPGTPASLGGTGTIGGAVTVKSNGTLFMGVDTTSTIGTLTVNNNVTLENNSTHVWKIAAGTPMPSTMPGGSDGSSGAQDLLSLTGTSSALIMGNITFNIVEIGVVNLNPNSSYSFTVATTPVTAAAPTLGTVTFNTTNAADFTSYANVTGNSMTLLISGNNEYLVLTSTPAPEPRHILSLGVGILLAGFTILRCGKFGIGLLR